MRGQRSRAPPQPFPLSRARPSPCRLVKGTAPRARQFCGQPPALRASLYLPWLSSCGPGCLQVCPRRSHLSSGTGATLGWATWGRRAISEARWPWRWSHKERPSLGQEAGLETRSEAAGPYSQRKRNYFKHLRQFLLALPHSLPPSFLPSSLPPSLSLSPAHTQRRVLAPPRAQGLKSGGCCSDSSRRAAPRSPPHPETKREARQAGRPLLRRVLLQPSPRTRPGKHVPLCPMGRLHPQNCSLPPVHAICAEVQGGSWKKPPSPTSE